MQACQRVVVPRLELAVAAPTPLVESVRGVAQLAARAHAHHHLRDQAAQIVGKLGRKGRHPILVHLHRRATSHGHLVCEQRDVLPVVIAVRVPVPNVVGVQDEVRQLDVARVADVAAALVEGGHRLHLPLPLPRHLEEIPVGAEVVHLGTLLRQPPPHIDHEPIQASPLQLVQHLPKIVQVLELAAVRNSVERQHDEHLCVMGVLL
mmetsp:Transcript_40679/g.103525  ORF Transcript_40679/g.103525 Transcript_40679/m.103525 type:complete len:206 (-) Transcript_40679:311-928(-)